MKGRKARRGSRVRIANLGSKDKSARRLFREFVETSAGEGHRPEFHGMNILDGRVFGDDAFVEEVLRDELPMNTVTVDDILAAVREVCGLTAEEMLAPTQRMRVSEGRALAAWGVLYLSNRYAFTDFADEPNFGA